MALIVKTFRTDSGGNAHFPIDSYKVLLAVTTNTLNATLSISHNKHNMYYVNIKMVMMDYLMSVRLLYGD